MKHLLGSTHARDIACSIMNRDTVRSLGSTDRGVYTFHDGRQGTATYIFGNDILTTEERMALAPFASYRHPTTAYRSHGVTRLYRNPLTDVRIRAVRTWREIETFVWILPCQTENLPKLPLFGR